MQYPPKRVVLTGLSGSGKSSIGKMLNDLYSWLWLDVDAEVERRSSSTIGELIRVEGEQHFRALESSVLLEALDRGHDVISLGAGGLMDPQNAAAVTERALLVHLAVKPEVAAARVLGDEQVKAGDKRHPIRPLLEDTAGGEIDISSVTQRLENLLRQRSDVYSLARIRIWTDFAGRREVAEIVERETRLRNYDLEGDLQSGHSQPCRTVHIPCSYGAAGGTLSEIIIGADILSQLPRWLGEMLPQSARVAIVSDENVWRLWGDEFQRGLSELNRSVLAIALPPGETSKSLASLEQITEQLAGGGITRSDSLIALGGGVVGDVAGLAASLYMRGIPFVQVPSTVVAQVDSAIGGKTAIDLPYGKNLLGTFYPARLIASDIKLLKSLPEREFAAGMAEVIKYGLIASSEFFEWLERRAEDIRNRDDDVLLALVEECSLIKQLVVSADLHDLTGRRAVLNFGHTIGHAVEQLTGFEALLHGEAISIGMMEALFIGQLLQLHNESLSQRVARLLRKFALPLAVPERLLADADRFRAAQGLHSTKEVFAGEAGTADSNGVQREPQAGTDSEGEAFAGRWRSALKVDKKRSGSKMNFICLAKLGEAIVRPLSVETLLRAVAWPKNWEG